VTQAAARTRAMRLAELGIEFKRGLHDFLQSSLKSKHRDVATNHPDATQTKKSVAN
jgi:hypothetical protein